MNTNGYAKTIVAKVSLRLLWDTYTYIDNDKYLTNTGKSGGTYNNRELGVACG